MPAALLVAGCGGHGRAQSSPPRRPALPRALAAQLAAGSDAVARDLAADDGCSALQAAQSLQQQTIQAINRGRVPAALQETLQSTVNDLASRIHCAPPTTSTPSTPSPQGDQNGNGNGHGRGKGKGKDHGGDEGD